MICWIQDARAALGIRLYEGLQRSWACECMKRIRDAEVEVGDAICSKTLHKRNDMAYKSCIKCGINDKKAVPRLRGAVTSWLLLFCFSSHQKSLGYSPHPLLDDPFPLLVRIDLSDLPVAHRAR